MGLLSVSDLLSDIYKVQTFSTTLTAPHSCSTNTIFFSSWNADYSGWTNKTSQRIPSGLNLLVSSPGNTTHWKDVSLYKWESVCANIAWVKPQICHLLLKMKLNFILDQWNHLIDGTKKNINASQLFWITLYAAVLQVHAVVLYGLNTHHTVVFQ